MRRVALGIARKDGKYLAVSRKWDYEDFGFPGGKVEESETYQEGLIREVYEETGLVVTHIKGLVLATRSSQMEIRTFVIEVEGHIDQNKEEGVVAWVDEELLTQKSFGAYNENLLEELKRLEKK